MEYKDFRLELISHIAERYGISESDIQLHLKGFMSDIPLEREIIQNCNNSYLGIDSDILQDDFLFVDVNELESLQLSLRLYPRALFEDYQETGWSAVDKETDNYIDYVGLSQLRSAAALKNYNTAKDKLTVTLRNIASKSLLQNGVVYQRLEDFAITLYADLGYTENGLQAKAPITRKITDPWGIDENDLFAVALRNAEKKMSVRIADFHRVISRTVDKEEIAYTIDNEDEVALAKEHLGDCDSLILFTSPSVDGAVALFFEGVQEKISNIIGDNYLVAFINEEEVVLHRAGTIRPDTIRSNLRRSNAHGESMITEHAFSYDSKRHRLKKR